MIVNKLQEILTELNSTMNKLLEVSKSKQDVLINRDHENLNALINQEQRLLTEMNGLSNQQKAITEKLKTEFDVPAQLSSVSEILELIAERIDVNSVRQMMQILSEIKTTGEELHEINEQNKMLIETSREFIRGIIHAVRGSDNNSIINRKM